MESLLATKVFTPTATLTRGKKGAPIGLSLVDKVVVAHLPKGVSEEARRAFLFLVMCAGTSLSSSLNEWKAYVAVYTLAVAPGLEARMPASSFTLVPLTPAQVIELTTIFESFKSALSDRNESAVTDIVSRGAAASYIPGLPKWNPSLDWKPAGRMWVPKVMFGHYSIVLFLIGKRVDGDDHTSIAINRPDAIKKKAHLSMPVPFLDGDLRLSDSSHVLINNAWAELATLRGLALTEFAQFAQSDTNFSQDLIYTTMHLLRWGGMQHARITIDFLRAFPWVASIPSLRTPLAVFVESIRALEKIDPTLRSYVKLIYGDKSAVFPRKELEPLVACAVSVAKEINPTLEDFYVSNAYASIVDAFTEERDRRDKIREGELVQKERGLGLEVEEGEYESESATEIAQEETPAIA